MSPAPPRSLASIVYCVASLLACAFAVRTLALAYLMARPMPYWDAWEFMKALPAAMEGRYGLDALVAFHNEHRIVTTRLVMLADVRIADATGYLSTALTMALFCLIGGVLAASALDRGWPRFCAACLAAATLLSVAQSDNYASGFQVQFPLVDLFAIAAIGFFVLAVRRDRYAWPLLAAAVAADGLAIGSMASGNAVVGAVVLAAVALRAPLSRTLAFVGPALAMSAAYMVGFPRSDVPPSHDPLGIAHFAVDALGAALRGYPHGALALGAVLVAAYAAALVAMARTWVIREPIDPVLAWLAGVAAFAVGGAVITAVGRLSLGLETAISSRYAAQSLLFTCCIVLMAWRSAASRPGMALVGPGLALAWLGVAAASTLAAKPMGEWRDRVANYDVAGAAFAGGVFSDEAIAGVYPWPELVRPTLGYMARHRLGPFSERYAAVYRPPTNALVDVDAGALPICLGAADRWTATGPGWFALDGWVVGRAGQPGRGGTVVAFDGDGRAIGFASASLDRPDVAEALAMPASRSGYHLTVRVPGVAPAAFHPPKVVFVPDGIDGDRCVTATAG